MPQIKFPYKDFSSRNRPILATNGEMLPSVALYLGDSFAKEKAACFILIVSLLV